jgi:hypothetical protein
MKSLKIKKVTRRRKIRNTTNKKWFDKEYRFKRHAVRKIANKKHKDPQNLNLRNSYHELLKDYKNTLRLKKDEFYQQKLNELESAAEKNPQLFWKVLKTVNDDITNTTPNNIPESQWYSHFQTLHSKHNLNTEQQEILKELHRHEENLSQHDKLDLPISGTEIRNATKKLKRNKSTYSDRIKNEMLKYSINFMLQAYVKLFNLILKAGIFPTQWCEG